MGIEVAAGCVIDGHKYEPGDAPPVLEGDRKNDLLARGTLVDRDEETGELKPRPRRRIAEGVTSDPADDVDDTAADNRASQQGAKSGGRRQGSGSGH